MYMNKTIFIFQGDGTFEGSGGEFVSSFSYTKCLCRIEYLYLLETFITHISYSAVMYTC